MKKNKLESLFAPKSIAIVGASSKKGKVGTVIADNVSKLGYKGKIHYVNPSYKLLKLKKCYSSLSEIKTEIDLAIIAVPAKFVLDVVKDGMNVTKNFVVISAGFSETGKDGVEREKQLLEFAKKNDLKILGPNCLGFIVPHLKLNASFAGGLPEQGNIAFASQSGALAVALMDKANGENIGFSHVISVGNQMQIGESELLEYLGADKNTKVIGMYLEGIKNGKKFLETAKKVSKIKPIVILKAGKTEQAQHAISSHTGALAGSDEIVNIAFEKAGVIRANNLDEFFDLLTLISFTDAPKNNKVVVITNAGGVGVLATDAFSEKDISLTEIPTETKRNIKEKLPAEASVENPIDLLGDADEIRYKEALNELGTSFGSVISILTPQQQTPVEKVTNVILDFQKNGVNCTTVFVGGGRVNKSIESLKQNNIPNFQDPQRVINVLDKYYKWEAGRNKIEKIVTIEINRERKSQVENIIAKAKSEKRNALLFSEAAQIMDLYGIGSGKFWNISADSKMPDIDVFPLVAKVDSDKVLHKSDKQGVILNIKNKHELENAIEILKNNFPGEQILIQPMQQKQIELILGVKKDEVFGPVIVYGLGGIYTEVFKMVDFIIPQMSSDDIEKHVLQSKIGFLFQGLRGQVAYNIDEFVKILVGLMEFVKEYDEFSGLDINPLFIYNDERVASAVDIKIIL